MVENAYVKLNSININIITKSYKNYFDLWQIIKTKMLFPLIFNRLQWKFTINKLIFSYLKTRRCKYYTLNT